MKAEIPVRYQNTSEQQRFSEGDVIFTISRESVSKLVRYVVELSYPGEIYKVRRLNDSGQKVGNEVRLKESVSARFEKDDLVTNLIKSNSDPLEL